MPKLYKITKNLFILTPSSNIYSSANVNFLIDKKITLIDAGTNNDPGPRNIKKILHSLGVSPRIESIIITHSHVDHFTGAKNLKKAFNSQIFAHYLTEKAIKQYSDFRNLGSFEYWEFIEKTFPIVRKTHFIKYLISFIYRRSFGNFEEFQLDRKLKEGDRINLGEFSFEVIFTPGHSPDSICLYEPNKKILFSGDMVPYTPYIHTSISDFRSSIKKLINLDAKLAIRGHGRPQIWQEEKKKYRQFLKDMDIAKRRILKILKLKGPQTAHKMANSVFQRTHLIHKTIYTNLMRVSVFWILKYLEELELEGRIKSQLIKNKLIFSLK